MTAHAHAAVADGTQAASHLVSPRTYITIFLALMVLTAVTVGVAVMVGVASGT